MDYSPEVLAQLTPLQRKVLSIPDSFWESLSRSLKNTKSPSITEAKNKEGDAKDDNNVVQRVSYPNPRNNSQNG